MTDPGLYIHDRHERSKKPNDNAWKKGPKITLKDCMNGTGEMEKTTLKEMLGNKFVPEDEMKFGKYKGQKLQWVKENDPNYWEWATQNVGGFDRLAKKVK